MKIQIPEDVQYILNQLHQHHHEAYIVGGCVRDALLGKKPTDWDITTSATPAEIQDIFTKTVDTGIKHGTVRVIYNHVCYEVTTFRIDQEYIDHRHPRSVIYTRNLQEDLKRRDFTINAMAYDEEHGIIDYHHGIEDLQKGIIRAVGDPLVRFEEDALRMMRAIRFSCQFGFQIDPDILYSIQKKAHLLTKISIERIQEEMTKILCSSNPQQFRLLYDLKITAILLPEFDIMMQTAQNNPHHCFSVGEHTLQALTYLEPNPILRLTMLFHDIGKPSAKTTDLNGIDHFHGHDEISSEMARSILHRFKYDRATIQQVSHLVYWHDYRVEPKSKAVRKAIQKVGIDSFHSLLQIQYADTMAQSDYLRTQKLQRLSQVKSIYQQILQENHCLSLSDLAITGKDLIAMGMTPGKEIGNCLQYLLECVIDHPEWNTKEQLIKIISNKKQ